MTDITQERVKEGIRRLLTAPSDLEKCGAPRWNPVYLHNASARHKSLFREYCEESDLVTCAASNWWAETLDARQRLAGERDRAARQAWIDRPAGPASFPGLVALVRDFWLACHNLNLESVLAERVPPEVFLLQWLIEDGNYQQAVDVLACMPYWPIGLDREGNWV
jgi:hypothetical protein